MTATFRPIGNRNENTRILRCLIRGTWISGILQQTLPRVIYANDSLDVRFLHVRTPYLYISVSASAAHSDRVEGGDVAALTTNQSFAAIRFKV